MTRLSERSKGGIIVGASLATAFAISMTAWAAANVFVSQQVEGGTKSSSVQTVADTSASGSSVIKFNAAGGFQANCINVPSACGYPDATNTGVPAGATLTNSGCITVNTAGAVIQNLNIVDCNITVNANNVTIRNVRISGCTYYPIDYSGRTGLVVEDTTIAMDCDVATAALSFDNYIARRINVSGTADGFKANGNVTIEDSYIHDLAVTQDSHNDGIQTTGGSGVTVRHNTCKMAGQGVCIQFGPSDSGWLVTNNLFNGEGWIINGNNGTSNSTFTNNRFTRTGFGPASITGSGNTWSGNYYDDNGAVANQ